MASYYINPSATTNGTGTAASPFNTWVGVPVAAGNKYYQKRGTTYTGSFPSLTSGTAGNITTIAPYANTDGSDDTSQAKPVIDIGDTVMPGTINGPKTYIKFYRLDIRNNRSVVSSDKPIMWLGNFTEISQCNLTTNLTALYGEAVSNVKVDGCTITCATATGSVAMNAVVLSGAGAQDNNSITSNIINVGNGGNVSSHIIKCEPYAGTIQTNLKVSYNMIRPISNSMSLVARRGISILNCLGGEFAYNNVAFMHAGLFAGGASKNLWIHHNSFNNNGAFGIHVTTNTENFLIEWNTCNQNGGNYSQMNWYGRGIELSAGGELYKCHGHVVRYNTCNQNYNYGGPLDNATEGVGIGLDDASTNCAVYGNIMKDNEGNGLQLYGGSTPPDDSGGHTIFNNYFINNATQSYRNRRSGTKYLTDGACHIGCSGTQGSKTIIANNMFSGSYGGIRESSNCSNIEKYCNVFSGQTGYAIAVSGVKYYCGSGGFIYNSSGLLEKTAPGSMRLTYNPVNLAAAPVALVESTAANVLPDTEVFSNTSVWTVTNSTAPSTTQVVAPRLNSPVYKLTENVTSAQKKIRTGAYSIKANEKRTFSVYAKAGERSGLFLQINGYGGNYGNALFNLADGTARTPITYGEAYGYSSGIEGVGDGWYRVWLTGTPRTSSNATIADHDIILSLTNSGSGFVGYPGDGTSGVYLFGANVSKWDISSYMLNESMRSADKPEIHHNFYSPSITKKIVNLATDANGVPTPAQISSGSTGDLTVDPKLDSKFQPLQGSPLFNLELRENVPWFMMPLAF